MRLRNYESIAFSYLLIIVYLVFLSSQVWAKGGTKRAVLPEDPPLKVSFKAGLLSLEARGVKAEDIFKEISEKCGVEIRNYGSVFPPDPLNIRFTDLTLKKGMKKIIRIARIKNHSMLYREVKPGQYQVYAIDFLGESKGSITGKPSLERFTKAANQKQISIDTKGKEDSPEGNFEEKMEEFKDKYQWDSSDTQELAGYLLEAMPEGIKGAGLDEIINGLDKRIKEGGEDTVDEEMFFKAIEGTIPPHIAPLVMSHIKKKVNEFKGEEVYEIPEELPSEIYQDSFNKKEFNEEN